MISSPVEVCVTDASAVANTALRPNTPPAAVGSERYAEDMHFLHPDQGTPAALALAANANIRANTFDKGLRKFKGMQRAFQKSTKDRKFSHNFKGKLIDGIHEQYTLTIGMMLGIRVALDGLYNHSDGSDSGLIVDDFSYVEKLEFPPDGNLKPPHITPAHTLSHTFKFKTYAPKVFSKIRQLFGVDTESYMGSVCGDSNYLEFIANSKSGQFFFYSSDGRYIIKTQSEEECQFMKRILPHYYKYMSENRSTQIVKIFGMHRVKMYHLNRKIHFVIMASVFDTTEVIHQIFDLKGSRVGRSATESEKAKGGVLKDNDLVDDGVKIHLGNKKAPLLAQVQADALFLASLNIMDYSLLVGIHKSGQSNDNTTDYFVCGGSDVGVSGGLSRSQTPFRTCRSDGALYLLGQGQGNRGDDVRVADIPPSDTHHPMSPHISHNCPGLTTPVNIVIDTDDDIAMGEGNIDPTSVLPDSKTTPVDTPNSYPPTSLLSKVKDTVLKMSGMMYGGSAPAAWAEGGSLSGVERAPDDELVTGSAGSDVVCSSGGGGSRSSIGSSRIVELFNRPGALAELIHASDRLAKDTRPRLLSADVCTRQWTRRVDHGITAVEPTTVADRRTKYVYYIGIIDILQEYNARKRVETLYKGIFNGTAGISSMPAPQYAERFIRFVGDSID